MKSERTIPEYNASSNLVLFTGSAVHIVGNIVPAKMHIASSLTGIPKPAAVRQKKYTSGGVVDRTDVIESVECESACISVVIDEKREGDDDICSAVFLLVDLDSDRCDVNVGMRGDKA